MADAEVNLGWEEKYQEIRNSAYLKEFHDDLNLITGHLVDNLFRQGLLTSDQGTRSLWKIKLLYPFITRMCINMMKGSIKYTTNDWSSETWADMGMDDKADSVNYDVLFQDHLRKEGKL